MISFLDLKAGYLELSAEIDAAVHRVVSSGWYIGGPEVAAFEAEFACYVGAANCVGTGNGLDALVLALRACDIGAGDEVIVPSHTFIATWLAVSAVGATVVPVEPDLATSNIDANRIADAVTPRTRAIMPVHLYGQPADLDAVLAVAKAHDLRVIEDAAQCHGARYKDHRIGAHGDIVCWSFYPGKNLGALGDGGAVTTNNADLAARVRRLGNYGSDQKYVNTERGTNSRLDPVQAAVLRVKLDVLDEWTERRRRVAAHYQAGLADAKVTLPQVPQWADPVWHLYVVRSADRDGLQKHLGEAGIGSLSHYPIAPHMQDAYADLGLSPDALPLARRLADEVLSLPMSPHISEAEVDQVIEAVRKFS